MQRYYKKLVYKSFSLKKFTEWEFLCNFVVPNRASLRQMFGRRSDRLAFGYLSFLDTDLGHNHMDGTSPFHSALYRWYEQNQRILPWRETQDPYRIWISEIILQQTRVVQGMAYYLRFVERFPDAQTLAQAPEDEVLRYWQGLGYYSRARNLHKAAQMIVAQGWLPFPKTFNDIRQLPGVGDYTAGAIASFAYNAPYPAMDGNVYRVVARLFDCEVPFDTGAGKKHFHSLLDKVFDADNARLFNSAIMEFGALYCTPSLTTADGNENTACEQCSIGVYCAANKHNTTALLPIRKARPTLKDRYLNYYIYVCYKDGNATTLLHQRAEKDIWQHLYEFPLEEADHQLSKEDVASRTGIVPTLTFDTLHVLSHQRLHTRFFVLQTDTLPTLPSEPTTLHGAFEIPVRELDKYALSRLTLKALEHLRWG